MAISKRFRTEIAETMYEDSVVEVEGAYIFDWAVQNALGTQHLLVDELRRIKITQKVNPYATEWQLLVGKAVSGAINRLPNLQWLELVVDYHTKQTVGPNGLPVQNDEVRIGVAEALIVIGGIRGPSAAQSREVSSSDCGRIHHFLACGSRLGLPSDPGIRQNEAESTQEKSTEIPDHQCR
jgi:hypothetical protein